MMGQAEVVVRPQHDPLLAVNDDHGVLGLRDRIEVGIETGRLDLARLGELAALIEERDLIEALEYPRRLGAGKKSGSTPHRYVAERFKLVTHPE